LFGLVFNSQDINVCGGEGTVSIMTSFLHQALLLRFAGVCNKRSCMPKLPWNVSNLWSDWLKKIREHLFVSLLRFALLRSNQACKVATHCIWNDVHKIIVSHTLKMHGQVFLLTAVR